MRVSVLNFLGDILFLLIPMNKFDLFICLSEKQHAKVNYYICHSIHIQNLQNHSSTYDAFTVSAYLQKFTHKAFWKNSYKRKSATIPASKPRLNTIKSIWNIFYTCTYMSIYFPFSHRKPQYVLLPTNISELLRDEGL
jgi:hypothetical protein